MASTARSALLLILLLVGSEAVRVETQLGSVEELVRKATCDKLRSQLDTLSVYLPAKVAKVDEKGIGGVKGKMRIVKLGRKANAFSSAISKFEKNGCEGDLDELKEGMQDAMNKVKEIVDAGGSDAAGLKAAMAQTEARMEYVKTLPQEQQAHASRAMVAGFMRAVLSGGGEMTAQEEAKIVGSSTEKNTAIFDEAEKEDAEGENLLEIHHSMENALVELSKMNATAEVDTKKSGNIFWSALKGLAKIVAVCVLAVLGLVWLLVASVVGVLSAFWLGAWLGSAIICGMWWLLGQIVNFFTLGGFSFGQDYQLCFNTLLFGPIKKGFELHDYMLANNTPWNYMEGVVMSDLQVSQNTTA